MKQRIIYWDIIKCFAIFLVVWGHCMQNMTSISNYLFTDSVAEWIYSFHMALFMMTSGYFALNSLSKPLGETIKSRSIQILLPSITWYIIIRSISLFAHQQLFTSFGFYELLIGSLTSMWFLKSLFCCYVITLIGNWLYAKHPYTIFFYICLVIASGPLLNYSHTFAMLPFFIAGIFLHKYEEYFFNHAKILFSHLSLFGA